MILIDRLFNNDFEPRERGLITAWAMALVFVALLIGRASEDNIAVLFGGDGAFVSLLASIVVFFGLTLAAWLNGFRYIDRCAIALAAALCFLVGVRYFGSIAGDKAGILAFASFALTSTAVVWIIGHHPPILRPQKVT
jgi:hypothetical protein